MSWHVLNLWINFPVKLGVHEYVVRYLKKIVELATKLHGKKIILFCWFVVRVWLWFWPHTTTTLHIHFVWNNDINWFRINYLLHILHRYDENARPQVYVYWWTSNKILRIHVSFMFVVLLETITETTTKSRWKSPQNKKRNIIPLSWDLIEWLNP